MFLRITKPIAVLVFLREDFRFTNEQTIRLFVAKNDIEGNRKKLSSFENF